MPDTGTTISHATASASSEDSTYATGTGKTSPHNSRPTSRPSPSCCSFIPQTIPSGSAAARSTVPSGPTSPRKPPTTTATSISPSCAASSNRWTVSRSTTRTRSGTSPCRTERSATGSASRACSPERKMKTRSTASWSCSFGARCCRIVNSTGWTHTRETFPT